MKGFVRTGEYCPFTLNASSEIGGEATRKPNSPPLSQTWGFFFSSASVISGDLHARCFVFATEPSLATRCSIEIDLNRKKPLNFKRSASGAQLT